MAKVIVNQAELYNALKRTIVTDLTTDNGSSLSKAYQKQLDAIIPKTIETVISKESKQEIATAFMEGMQEVSGFLSAGIKGAFRAKSSLAGGIKLNPSWAALSKLYRKRKPEGTQNLFWKRGGNPKKQEISTADAFRLAMAGIKGALKPNVYMHWQGQAKVNGKARYKIYTRYNLDIGKVGGSFADYVFRHSFLTGAPEKAPLGYKDNTFGKAPYIETDWPGAGRRYRPFMAAVMARQNKKVVDRLNKRLARMKV